jgi:CBS domain containing-hemolysin-like protein
MSDTTALVLAVVLLIGNAFFVGAEFALISARRSQIEPLADAGDRRARITVRAMEDVSQMMAGAQLGITVCSLGLGATAEPAIAHLIEPVLESLGLPTGLVHPIAFTLALSLVVYLHMVLGEMVPKNIALAGPERSALLLGPPLAGIVTVLRPVIAVVNAIANLVLRLLRVQPKDEVTSTFTRDEVATMIGESSREGLLDQQETTILERALHSSTAVARDILVPSDALVTVEADQSTAALYDALVRSGFSRFPVRDADGALRRYVHIHDALASDNPVSTGVWLQAGLVGDLPLHPLTQIAPDLALSGVVQRMRADASHLASVVDEAGATIGVVTLEDALETIIGEVRDPAQRHR